MCVPVCISTLKSDLVRWQIALFQMKIHVLGSLKISEVIKFLTLAKENNVTKF